MSRKLALTRRRGLPRRSPARDPATKNLKLAVVQLLKATKRASLPCSCKGRHFDDLAPAGRNARRLLKRGLLERLVAFGLLLGTRRLECGQIGRALRRLDFLKWPTSRRERHSTASSCREGLRWRRRIFPSALGRSAKAARDHIRLQLRGR